MTVQDLWRDRYQILLIILPEDLKKLNLNTDTMIKNVKLAELNTKIAIAFFNAKTLKDDLTEQKCLCCNKNNQKKV